MDSGGERLIDSDAEEDPGFDPEPPSQAEYSQAEYGQAEYSQVEYGHVEPGQAEYADDGYDQADYDYTPAGYDRGVDTAEPGRTRPRVLRRRPRRSGVGARRTAVNLLIGCTGADHRAVTERDRSRYASAGALMLLTASLAAYAGASVAAFGFGTSTLAALPYGLFYAAFIFFIDRSVLLTIRPLRLAGKGDKERIRPRRLLPTGVVRILIAVIGAILVGESLLLRFFDASIEPRVAELRQQELAGVMSSWDAGQRTTEAGLVAALDDQRTQLASAENLVTSKTGEVDCQLTGGDGCLGGRGPIYQVKLGELQAAAAQIPGLRAARDAAQNRLDSFRVTRDQRRAQYADTEWRSIGNANDLLMREKGFWRLTAADNSVKVWRILISLLILGIDLAPLLFKRNLDRTAYARLERGALWEGETTEEVDAFQLDRNARARRGKAGAVAERMAARYQEYAVAREELRLAASLDEDAGAAALRRDERRLGNDRQAADLRRAYRLPAPLATPPPRGAAADGTGSHTPG
jgi:hypothetical protein